MLFDFFFIPSSEVLFKFKGFSKFESNSLSFQELLEQHFFGALQSLYPK